MPFLSLHLTNILLPALGIIVCAASLVADSDQFTPKYFRSDLGVAEPTAGSLPGHLEAAGALRWRVPLDSGQSTPVICKGKIFLTTYAETSKELATVALDQKSGAILWKQPAPSTQIETYHPQMGNAAVSTPACDGKKLYVFFGSYGLVCCDLEGKTLWEYPMGPFRDEYGAGSSPVLVDGKVVLNQDHDIDSFLIAIDCLTGKKSWKIERPEAVRSYSSPAIWTHNGRKELLVAGALELASYHPSTGKKLWSRHGLARIVIPVPIPSGGMIYMASWAPGGDSARRISLDSWPAALAKWDKDHDGKLSKIEIDDREVLDRFYRMDLNQNGTLDQREWDRHAEVFSRAQNAVLALKPSGEGELDDRDLIWKYQRGVPYVATPLLDKGILWMVKDGGIVTKLDATTGRVLQEERLPGLGGYYASPVTGDGKVYFASEQGIVSVVANQKDWEVISSRDFQEKIYATPVIDQGFIYVRTEKALYSFQGGKN